MESKVFFENGRGARLCGVFSAPRGRAQGAGVVLSHGFHSSKDGKTCTALAGRLARHGIASLRFDFYGSGESAGSDADITPGEAVDDVISADRFLRSQGFKRIALFGSSFGGTASLMAAAQVEAALLALKSPISSYRDKLNAELDEERLARWQAEGVMAYASPGGRTRVLHYAFYREACDYDCYAAAARLKLPALIVHGGADRVVPVAQSRRTAGLMAGCRLCVIEGADHEYSRPEHFARMLDEFETFITAEI